MAPQLENKPKARDVCLRCAQPVADRRRAVRVSGGTYAHRGCVTYRRRARR
jgi:hypothetical protein